MQYFYSWKTIFQYEFMYIAKYNLNSFNQYNSQNE